MKTYKIKSLTDTLPKRHAYKNQELNITIIDSFMKKNVNIPTGKEIYITVEGSLPAQIHKFRSEGLIIVQGVGKAKQDDKVVNYAKSITKKDLEAKTEEDIIEDDSDNEDENKTSKTKNKTSSSRKSSRKSTTTTEPPVDDTKEGE